MAERFAVVGRPILHSRSPALFRRAFLDAAPGEPARSTYVRLAAASADEALAVARELGLRGLNVTSPFKETMAARMDDLDDEARATAAVNTVLIGHRLQGHNTDPRGVEGAFAERGASLLRSTVAVFGTGGAARAATLGAMRAGAARVVLISRQAERARQVAERLEPAAARIATDRGRGASEPRHPSDRLIAGSAVAETADVMRRSNVVISCLPRGVELVDPTWLRPDHTVMDANYGASRLESAARALGCRTVPGESWLLHQAAESFERFTGASAPVAAMTAALGSTQSGGRADRSNIALTGFMGAGKSTVGAELARRSTMSFVDTDRACELQAGATIDQLFAQPGGEERFRRLERAELRRIETARSTVFACGGGALLDAGIRKTVSDNAVIVWLWAPLDACLSRLEGQSRPLLHGLGRKGTAALLQRRLPSYAESADLVISVAARTATEVATELAHEFRAVSEDPRHTDNG